MIRILLVDDEPQLLEIAKQFLENLTEVDVEVSLSGKDAIHKIQTTRYDAIVSDYQMPEMDGIELLRWIRANIGTVPFILFTGKGREEVVIDALNAGADFYLQKGGDPQSQFAELSDMIAKAVKRRRMESEMMENEEKFENIFNSANDAIFILALDGRCLEINDVGCARLGYSREEMRQRKLTDIDTPRYAALFPSRMKEVMERGFAIFEVEWMTKDGTLIPSEVSSRRINYAGQPAILSVARDITERKRNEALLIEKETKFSTVADFTYDWEYWIAPEGRIIYCSPSCKRISGYSSDELSRDPRLILDMVIPEDRHLLADHFDDEKGAEPSHFDYRIRTRKDEIRWISHNCQAVFDDDGKLLGRRASNRDITERKKAEESLRANEQKLSLILNNLTDSVWLLDMKLKFVWMSPSIYLRSGYTLDDLNRMPLNEQMEPASYKKAMRGISTMTAPENLRDPDGMINFSDELGFYKKGGGIQWLDIVSTLIRDENARPTGILMVGRDITEKKLVEDELALTKGIFRESRAAMGLANEKGIMTDVNEAFLNYLGYQSKDEVLLRPISDFMSDQVEMEGIMKELDLKGRWQGEYHAKKKDGSNIMVYGLATALRDDRGRTIGYQSTAIDITDRGVSQETSSATNVKLNILSNITVHDIQNQVVVLNGLVYKAKHANSPVQVKEYLNRMQQVADKIQSHVAFARDYQNLGKAPPSWIRLDMGIIDLASKFDSKWVQFEVDLGSLEVFSDAMLNRAFYNLIDDTLKHGQKATRVRFSAKPRGDGLILIYEDNGVGVPTDRKKSIFEKPASSQKVHGLVLVKEILGITGMTIQEMGEPGKGARFEIEVPRGNFRYPGNETKPK